MSDWNKTIQKMFASETEVKRLREATIEECAAEGWRDISSAPHACHFLATYWAEDCAEWVVGIVMLPLSGRWTHWRMLPASPNAASQDGGRDRE